MRGLFILTVLFAGSFADSLAANPVHIPFGKEASKLGVFRDGDYTKGPGFVEVDAAGQLWVADSYKERVAHFDVQGKFLDEVPLAGVSPRQFFFRHLSDGRFVTGNDQRLDLWSPKGELLSRTPLGLSLPDQIWATSTGLFAQLTTPGSSFVWKWYDYSPEPQRESLHLPQGDVAAFNDGRYWLPHWIDQKSVFHWKAAVFAGARLLAWTKEGSSVWVEKREGQGTAWWVDPQGNLVKSGPVHFPNSQAQGTAVSAAPDLTLVVSWWSEDELLIQTFHP